MGFPPKKSAPLPAKKPATAPPPKAAKHTGFTIPTKGQKSGPGYAGF